MLPSEPIMFDLFRSVRLLTRLFHKQSAATHSSGPPSASTCTCSCSYSSRDSAPPITHVSASLDAADKQPLPGVVQKAIDSTTADSDQLPDVMDVCTPKGLLDDIISRVSFPSIPDERGDSRAPSSQSTPSVHTSPCTIFRKEPSELPPVPKSITYSGKVISFKCKLGNGTFGSVMLGEIDGQPDFIRAVKVIRKEMYMLDPIPVTDEVSDYNNISYVRNEVKALLRINGFSPFLPRDAFFVQDYLFYYCIMVRRNVMKLTSS